jgi:fibronectin-binding autotransporter adhesin
MKTGSNPFLRLSSLLAATVAITTSAHADNLTWDAAINSSWNTADANWSSDTWDNSAPDSAIFGAAGVGTVTLTTGINVQNITFNTAGYTVSGNTLTLNNTTVTANQDATISSSFVNGSANSLIKEGSGTLTLTGANSYNGNTTINAGTLKIAEGASIYNGGYNNSAVLTVNNGATLELNRWGYGPGAANQSLGGLDYNPARFIINGGTVKYTGGAAGAPTDPAESPYGPGFTIGALGTTLDAAKVNDTWTVKFDSRGYGPITSTDGGTLTLTGIGNGIFDKQLGGTGGVVMNGAAKWTLNRINSYSGGTTVNSGTLELNSTSFDECVIRGALTVNSGATVNITGFDYAGLGRINGANVTALNVNGGTVNTSVDGWLTGATVNLTGGTMNGTGRHQIINSTLNSKASATTSTISTNLLVRKDFGSTDLTIDTENGAAATDLLISGSIQQVGATALTKTGAGTLELSGTNVYTGATNVNAGTLVLSGAGNYTGTIQVNNAGTLSLSNAVIDDAAPVLIASGATVNVNFVGSDTVGSLDIDGSGPLPAGEYNSGHTTYGSYFTGAGSLVVAGANGTWTALANGNWSDTANWQSGTVATGYDATATFNAATGVTVTLDSNRIIGKLAFDVSDYVIAGANTLTLDGIATPSISVASGRSATISANLGGIAGMEKTGAGSLVLSGVKSYTGNTTVTAGTLELSSATGDQSAVSGTLTVESGATLKISGSGYTGLGRLGARVTTLEVNGGTVNNTIDSWVTGATVNLTGGTMSGGTYHIISSGFNSIDTATTTSTISSNLLIRKDFGSADLGIDVGDGSAAIDMLISGNIGDVFAAGVAKNGLGKLVLSGTNTYTGNTVVNDGTLEVTSGLRFRPTDNGVTNSVSNSGTSTVTFSGTVELDLTAAAVANGNVWDLFNLISYSGLTPSAVTSTTLGSFTEGPAGTWELPVSGAKWVFTESNGQLTYVVTATDYDTWKSANGVTGGENDDDDSDGLTNHEEYAFGLDPTGGSEVNAIIVPFNKTNGTLSYTRRTQSLTGLTYTVWYSTDLSGWTEDTTAVQGMPSVSGEVETVPVTLTGTLLTNPKLFIQVRAE